MDIWLYFDATHADHVFCNPTSAPKIDELGRVLGLAPGQRVLDIACGFAECLVRWHERHGISGVGVDLSPYAIRRAEARRRQRAPDADLRLLEMPGAEYEAGAEFDVAMCLGASWIWNGFVGTLEALRRFVKPGGHVVSGEPFWISDPPDEYLAADNLRRDQFFTLEGCRRTVEDLGFQPVWMTVSTLEEWDAYELRQTPALERFARANPDHPDLPRMRAMRAAADEVYERWGRDHCGFAIWALRAG